MCVCVCVCVCVCMCVCVCVCVVHDKGSPQVCVWGWRCNTRKSIRELVYKIITEEVRIIIKLYCTCTVCDHQTYANFTMLVAS